MSYTTVELLQNHLVSVFPVGEAVVDQQVVMSGLEQISFFSGSVEPESVVVKVIATNAVTRTQVTTTVGRVSFVSSPVVFGSVVVAKDSSLGTVYVENIDYIIDYATGELMLKSGGAIAVAQQVSVWYLPYSIYDSGSDYSLDSTKGDVRRLSSGSIADGESVRVDYRPQYDSFNDDILNAAVNQANGLIEREIDPDGRFGADPVLQVCATYRGLEIVCHAAAARELSRPRGDQRSSLAWIELGKQFGSRADQLMKSFRPPMNGPASPVYS